MLETLVHDLIESLADAIVGVTLTIADDHQARRDKRADYETQANGHANRLLAHIVPKLQATVRNRYADWSVHPRLGHESLGAELRTAKIGLNESVMTLKGNPSVTNRINALAASIRLTAITEVLGAGCIFDDAAVRSAPIKTTNTVKPVRDNDKRLSRRAITIGDVSPVVMPLVAQLRASNPERFTALAKIEALRGGPDDADGIATQLATLAALEDDQAFIETLATHAAVVVKGADAASPSIKLECVQGQLPEPATTPVRAPVPIAERQLASASSVDANVPPVSGAALVADVPAPDPETAAAIGAISTFVSQQRWALIDNGGVFSLEKLTKRADLNRAFDKIATLPAMQDALRRVAASAISTP